MSISFKVSKEELIQIYKEQWEEANEAYEKNPTSSFEAWEWLRLHPIFNTLEGESYFKQALDIDMCKIDTNGTVNADKSVNVNTTVRLECGPIDLKSDAPEGYLEERRLPVDELGVFCGTHDYRLDCGGDSFEAAIVRLARLVKTNYGHDRQFVYKDRFSLS